MIYQDERHEIDIDVKDIRPTNVLVFGGHYGIDFQHPLPANLLSL